MCYWNWANWKCCKTNNWLINGKGPQLKCYQPNSSQFSRYSSFQVTYLSCSQNKTWNNNLKKKKITEKVNSHFQFIKSLVSSRINWICQTMDLIMQFPIHLVGYLLKITNFIFHPSQYYWHIFFTYTRMRVMFCV